MTHDQLEPWMGHDKLPVMDIGTAHTVLQRHLICMLDSCPIKRQARNRLIEAGKLVPAGYPYPMLRYPT